MSLQTISMYCHQELSRTFLFGLILISLLVMSITASSCISDGTIIAGKYLQDSTFSKQFRSSLYSCAAACYGHRICKSFNFDKEVKTCYLNFADMTSKPDLMREDPKYLYSDILSWPRDITGACQDHSCKREEHCSVTRNGSTACDINPSYGTNYELQFVLVEEKLNWTESLTECSNLGGILAVLDSQNRSNTVENIIKERGITSAVWIGATDAETEGIWVWVDGQNMTYHQWEITQPDNFINQDCSVAVYNNEDHGWYDRPCKHRSFFVCEMFADMD